MNSTAAPMVLHAALDGLSSGVRRAEQAVLQDTEGRGTDEVLNLRDDPERVRVLRPSTRIRGAVFDLEFAPFSVTRFRLELGRP